MKKIYILFITFITLVCLSGCSILTSLIDLTQQHQISAYSLKAQEESYLFEFTITNKEGTYVETSGTVDILIEDYNKTNVLYENKISFNDSTKFIINFDDIEKNSMSVGHFTFNVHTNKIEETKEMLITNLPTLQNNSNTDVVDVSNSGISYSNNQFIYQFGLLNSSNNNVVGFGDINIKIIDNLNITIFNKDYEFNESEFNNKLIDIKINKLELLSTEVDEGTIYINIKSDEFNFNLEHSISNIQNDNKTDIESLIEATSSEYAKKDIIDNNWGEEKTITEINNMISMYEELEQSMKEFMLGESSYKADNLVSLERNCFVILDTSKYYLSQIYVYEVMSAVLYDNPIYYYVDKSFSTVDRDKDGKTDTLYLYVADEYVNENVRENYNDMIENYMFECLKLVSGAEDDLEKTLLLHDKIVEEIDYDYYYDTHSFNILGVIAKEGPVCEGYAETFSMLLNYFDIPCYYVSGYAGENHAWNLVYLDDAWYWIDTTWNDIGNGSFNYKYFGMSNSLFLKDRTVSDNGTYIINNVLHYMIEIPNASNTALDISKYR